MPDVLPLRRTAYALLVVTSLATMLARVMSVNDPVHKRPFLSANDRSRWCTIRSLVEQGTYAIEDIIQDRGWDTIDMVKHLGTDGQPHLYSSKPPVLATVDAAPYWVVYKLTGHTLKEYPYGIGRPLLVLYNVVPMAIFFWLLILLVERFGRGDWDRMFVVACGTWGTFLTTFSITLNNHLPGAVCAMAATYCGLRVWCDGQRQWWLLAGAGFFGAALVACELPALSYFGLLGLAMLYKAPRQTLLAGVPPALLVLATLVTTNKLAHDSWSPAYLQREKGKDWQTGNWYIYTYERNGRTLDSYWKNRVGIDKARPPLGEYAFHLLLGHHGVFSLTPIWLLSMWGTIRLIRNRDELAPLAVASAICTVVIIAFLLTPLVDHNYGGMTCGLRWMFWFAPLWLLLMLSAVETLGSSRWGRLTACLLLGCSVFSAVYPAANPWTHPWITDLMLYNHWLSF